jgi:hypothetical protein
MDYIKNLLYILVGAFILIYATISIADFFDITISEYGNYLFFICALLIFYIILPKKSSSIF